ncbi:ankyrin repeat-containing domain protein [Aspergillus insuetus]
MSSTSTTATKDTLRQWVIPPIIAHYYTFTTGPCTIHPVTKNPTDKETCKAFAHLVAACEAGNAAEVRTFLADETRRRKIRSLWDAAPELYSPLDAAAPHAEILQLLIDKDFNPGCTEKFEVVARLLCNRNLTQASMDILLKNRLLFFNAALVLHFAFARGASREQTDFLLGNGIIPEPEEVHGFYKHGPLFTAIRYHKDYPTEENLDFVRWLLGKPEILNAYEARFETPLHLAARAGNVKVAEILLAEFKVDVNKESDFKRTPLFTAFEAAADGGLNVVPVLLKAGASVTVNSLMNFTPLHEAIQHCGNDKDILRMMFDEWVAEAGYKRPNLLFVATARLQDLELLKKLRPLCQQDGDSRALKKFLEHINGALADESKCLEILGREECWSEDMFLEAIDRESNS